MAQLVSEEAKFSECQKMPLIVDRLLVVVDSRFDTGRHFGRHFGRSHGSCGRGCGFPLLLFTLPGAVDHLEDLRLRRVNAGLVEERLEPLGLTDHAPLLTAQRMNCGHTAPYLVQLSELKWIQNNYFFSLAKLLARISKRKRENKVGCCCCPNKSSSLTELFLWEGKDQNQGSIAGQNG